MNSTISMDDLADLILERASKEGATYCEARVEELSNETINVEGRLLKSSFDYSSKGVGIRVIADGAWGFSSTTKLDNLSLEDAVESAVKIGRSAGTRRRTPVRLQKVKPARDNVVTKVREKFSDVDFKDKVNSLVESNTRLKASNEVIKTTAAMVGVESHKYIATSEGARIDFKHSMAFSTLSAFGFSSGISELATFEVGGSGGYEAVEPGLLIQSSQSVGERVIRLLKAKACPKIGETQIVMDPSFLALLVHEIIGHPSEADRVLGWENAWGGGAWWQGMLRRKVGSDLLSAVDEGGIEGTLGYTPYDDEAVKCRRTYLIEQGKLVGHIQSRQTAEKFSVEATGGMRSFSFDCIPLIRMSNTFILGGDWKSEEIVRETKNGIFVKYYVGPSIDDKRFRWTVSPQETYIIKNGELGELYRGAVVMGTAPEFFKSIDAVGQDLAILPLTGCGKGDPEQLICVGNGGPTLRSRANIVPRGE
nr:TldD/PmbA family protein [Candidatus Njordarchaeum guaymaensis]